jgi:hypothetical protein
MEGAAAQVGVEGGEPPGWWNSWDGADTDALVALSGGIDTIRDKLLAMDEKIGGQGLTIVGVPEPRKFKKSSQIWNGSELGTTHDAEAGRSTRCSLQYKWRRAVDGAGSRLACYARPRCFTEGAV